jgi:hypothetical protein
VVFQIVYSARSDKKIHGDDQGRRIKSASYPNRPKQHKEQGTSERRTQISLSAI